MCQCDVGADRRVRPVWDGGHTDAETRMQTDGEAVLQTLTAVWRGMRHLRECGKGGNDLEEVERVWSWFDRLRGRCPCVLGAAGVASRHAAVSDCGTVSPSGLTMCLSDVGTCVWGEYACS